MSFTYNVLPMIGEDSPLIKNKEEFLMCLLLSEVYVESNVIYSNNDQKTLSENTLSPFRGRVLMKLLKNLKDKGFIHIDSKKRIALGTSSEDENVSLYAKEVSEESVDSLKELKPSIQHYIDVAYDSAIKRGKKADIDEPIDDIKKILDGDFGGLTLPLATNYYRGLIHIYFQKKPRGFDVKDRQCLKIMLGKYEEVDIIKMITFYVFNHDKYHKGLPTLALLSYHKDKVYYDTFNLGSKDKFRENDAGNNESF